MVGSINIHAKFSGTERQDDEYEDYHMSGEAKLRFRRTSDYLRHCSENDGMITVFDASYAGYDNKVCFVFLHSIKFISEEKEMRKIPEERPEPAKEESAATGTGFSLRERLRQGR